MISSPNTVLANSLVKTEDLIGSRISIDRPKKIEFCVGTQINGVPHLGTYLVHVIAFRLAQRTYERYGIECSVNFVALDNSPYDFCQGFDGTIFQRNYANVISIKEMSDLLERHYLTFFKKLSKLTGIPYKYNTYTYIQKSPKFRLMFLKSLSFLDKLKWACSLSDGKYRLRFPNSKDDYYCQKKGESTKLIYFDYNIAKFEICNRFGCRQEIEISGSGTDGNYVDLNTLYRNIIKESIYAEKQGVLGVMVKGGDWARSTQPIDWGLSIMGYTNLQCPMRIFTPQVLTMDGAKLSKSLIRTGDVSMREVPEWVLDMSILANSQSNYVELLLSFVDLLMSDPKHMFRDYSYKKVIELLNQLELTDHEGQIKY